MSYKLSFLVLCFGSHGSLVFMVLTWLSLLFSACGSLPLTSRTTLPQELESGKNLENHKNQRIMRTREPQEQTRESWEPANQMRTREPAENHENQRTTVKNQTTKGPDNIGGFLSNLFLLLSKIYYCFYCWVKCDTGCVYYTKACWS